MSEIEWVWVCVKERENEGEIEEGKEGSLSVRERESEGVRERVWRSETERDKWTLCNALGITRLFTYSKKHDMEKNSPFNLK